MKNTGLLIGAALLFLIAHLSVHMFGAWNAACGAITACFGLMGFILLLRALVEDNREVKLPLTLAGLLGALMSVSGIVLMLNPPF